MVPEGRPVRRAALFQCRNPGNKFLRYRRNLKSHKTIFYTMKIIDRNTLCNCKQQKAAGFNEVTAPPKYFGFRGSAPAGCGHVAPGP
jgi:hypothetical protein